MTTHEEVSSQARLRRRRLVAGAAVVMAGAITAVTGLAPAAGSGSGGVVAPDRPWKAPAGPAANWSKCGPRMTFLVWPHGHPALPLIGFPRIQNPHVEAYIDFGKQWPDSRAGAYVIGGRPPAGIPTGDVLGPCLNYGDSSAAATDPIAGGVTIDRQTAVECVFPSTGVFDIVDRPGKVEILLFHTGKKLLARAVATPTNASVTVPRTSCHDVRSPGKPPG